MIKVYHDSFLATQHDQQRLKLTLTDSALSPLHIDFTAGAMRHRLQQGGGKSQAIAKAIGVSGKHCPSVDCTAGLGKDSFVLAPRLPNYRH